ncbi:MAG: DUF2059 domain-containing protein [Gammaproteobacteria bacterium]|nr:DUF2059 domain-containing protein [Gammaproteobacteria bacterium]
MKKILITVISFVIISINTTNAQVSNSTAIDNYKEAVLLFDSMNIKNSEMFKQLRIKNDSKLYKDILQAMLLVYAKTYSKEELLGLIDFYNSPIGKAYTNKNDLITQKIVKILPAIIMKHSANYQRGRK